MDLTECRKELDILDREIVALLEKRMEISCLVAEDKMRTGKPILDEVRERQKLDAVEELTKKELYRPAVRSIFTEIMKTSRALQEMWQKR